MDLFCQFKSMEECAAKQRKGSEKKEKEKTGKSFFHQVNMFLFKRMRGFVKRTDF